MKVIEGGFKKDKGATAADVFSSIPQQDDMSKYNYALCVAQSDDHITIASNMDPQALYFLLDQLKMSILTNGEYSL